MIEIIEGVVLIALSAPAIFAILRGSIDDMNMVADPWRAPVRIIYCAFCAVIIFVCAGVIIADALVGGDGGVHVVAFLLISLGIMRAILWAVAAARFYGLWPVAVVCGSLAGIVAIAELAK